jgi:hypothetical protein
MIAKVAQCYPGAAGVGFWWAGGAPVHFTVSPWDVPGQVSVEAARSAAAQSVAVAAALQEEHVAMLKSVLSIRTEALASHRRALVAHQQLDSLQAEVLDLRAALEAAQTLVADATAAQLQAEQVNEWISHIFSKNLVRSVPDATGAQLQADQANKWTSRIVCQSLVCSVHIVLYSSPWALDGMQRKVSCKSQRIPSGQTYPI